MKVISSALIMLAAASPAQSLELEPLWITEGFSNPESVIPSADGEAWFVSNVAGQAAEKDGNGFIARLSPQGQLLEKEWVAGLDAPKGMAIDGNTLWVSDIDQVVGIDIAAGKIAERVPVEGAKFLNDVTVIAPGTLLVSDSAGATIYCLHDGTVTPWLADERLGGVNGLHPKGDEVLVTTMAEGYLLSVDIASQQIKPIASGMTNADGIAEITDGFLVSSWPGQLHQVAGDGSFDTIIDTRETPIYFNDIMRIGDLLVTPNWQPSTVRAYRIVE